MAKGSSYEREVCRRLSRWWTAGMRDDIFYRTGGSGARATVRRAKGIATAYQHGDVSCSHPDGAPLLDAFTIEIKRGYTTATCHDLLDRPKQLKNVKFEQWISKADREASEVGVFGWLLITRRDRREPVIWTSWDTYDGLTQLGVLWLNNREIRAQFMVDVSCYDVVGMLLQDFLAVVHKQHILKLEHTL